MCSMVDLSSFRTPGVLPSSNCGLSSPLVPSRFKYRRLPRRVTARAFPNSMLPFTGLEEDFLEQERQMAEFQKQMNDQIQKELSSDAFTTKSETKSGYRIETRESRTESGYSYSYSKSVTVVGPGMSDMPMQGYGFEPAMLGLVAAYSVVCYLFNKGFQTTTFREGKKLPLLIAWPVLAVFNRRFREQLTSAVKAGWRGNRKKKEPPNDGQDV